MATMSHSESRRLYSWWWDSHINPKNSKWLQDNLTDIDGKVKTMIKLIEEDADSFARRAEMYYKKRPELMKLVEEFYRAYRALAERYDHATGELRHAQKTMAAVFPNQLLFPFSENSEILNTDDFGSAEGNKSLKQLQEMFGALENSKIGEENERNFEGELSILCGENEDLKGRAKKAENEIEILKKGLEDLRNEKEGVVKQYEESVEKLSNLERELGGVKEEASKAKTEVEKIKEIRLRLEAEREAALLKINKYIEIISKLEADLSKARKDEEGITGRAVKAEAETGYFKEEISKLKMKNNDVRSEYKQCLEKVSDLEKKLLFTREKANVLKERADRAENEVKALNKAFAEASDSKEGIVFRYENCLDKISKLERELSHARDDIESLNNAMRLKSEKLGNVEEKCVLLESSNHALQLEANNLGKKITIKNEEILRKDEEIERVQLGLKNENNRFVHAEDTLRTLRNLHSQAQREQKALALELKNGLKMIKEMEEKKIGLEEEIIQVKDENKILKESDSSSKIAIENLESEVVKLKEMKERLERQVGFQMGQTNILEKEINRLNEDIDGLNRKCKNVIEKIESVGLDPESIESSVKDLINQNSELREICERERDEKHIFVQKLDNMKQILDKNATLEGSIMALSGELEKSQEKIDELRGEKSSLVDEKAVILSHLQAISENMQKLLERNIFLENSLTGANIELLSLRKKAKSLEELCKSLSNDKSDILNETSILVVQLGNVEQRLENLEKIFSELEVRYVGLKKEKEIILSQVVELRTCLDLEKQKRANLKLTSETRLTRLEDHVQLLQEESRKRKKEFEEELDRSVNAQFEIFVLQKFIQDMEQKNLSLLLECQKHVEASKLSDKVISELENENLEQQVETEMLLDEIEKLRMGLYQVFKALEISQDHELVDIMENKNIIFDSVVKNIDDLKFSLLSCKDDNCKLSIENFVILTLFGQLKLETSDFVSENNIFQRRCNVTNEQLVIELNEKNKIMEMNKQLNLEVKSRDQIIDELKAEIERLGDEKREMKKAYVKVNDEYSKKLEENRSLLETLLDLKEKNNMVEEEKHFILVEVLALDNKSIYLKNFGAEKVKENMWLSEDLQKLEGLKSDLENEIGELKNEMIMKERENLVLNKCVKKLEEELNEVRDINTQLLHEISNVKNFLNKKEVENLMVKEKLRAKEERNAQLCRNVEGLKRKNEGTKLVVENLEKNISNLSQENKNQKNEVDNLREFNGFLESEVEMLREEIEERKIRENKLNLELKEMSDEFQMFETEAETFHFDLQISSIREVFLENKVQELSFACETIENERDNKMAEIEEMKQRVVILEGEICGLKNQLFAYDPVIDSLRDNVLSLEKKILSRQEIDVADIRRSEDFELTINLHEKSSQNPIPNGVSELQQLQNRIKEVEKIVTKEIKSREKLKIPKTNNSKLEAAMREIQDLKSCSLRFENDKQNTKPEFFEIKNRTKDIPLDDISSDSLYGVSRRRFQRADDQMLELWETSEEDHSLGRIKTKLINPKNLSRRFENRSDSSMELLIEKELGVDRLEVTESTQDRNKRKILERLSSDAQKLKSIIKTVDDLRKKLEENATKKQKAKNIDFVKVREQMKEVEETIVQLVEINEKLTKNIQENAVYSDKKGSPELEVIGNLRRKRVADQARKGSEKIGRLLIEVQKIQYILSKIEDEKKGKGKIHFTKNKTSFIFRDFISGKKRSSPKRKKPCLCGCFRTTSSGEGRSISEFNHLSYE